MNRSPLRALLTALMLCLASTLTWAQGTMVRLHTTQGPLDFRLLDAEAPQTVANFLRYVNGGDYTDVFFHRSAKFANGQPFVIQAGGFKWPAGATGCCAEVASRGNLVNEFSAARSNLRGTVAMAKLGGDPNSATSQWFVNMSDNSANLDNQNGGFTVFARVTTPGMAVADRIAALRVVNAGGVYSELPVANLTGSTLQRDNMVRIDQVTVFPQASQQSDFDRIANYLEAAYSQYLSPSNGAPGTAEGYVYRYYAGSNAYIATRNGRMYYLAPALAPGVQDAGDVAGWLATAQAAGY